MAKIETTFIRPKELYTPETGETKVVYDGYQNNPHELVVEENLEGEVSEIVNDTFVPNEGGNVVFTDNNETEHELITEDGFAGALDTAMPTALAKAQVIETTWQELKDKRDNGQLIAGSLYRITDYNCTTTQENTRSAGHQFDIVLLALSENKLAEEGWAMMNESNVYDVTFADGVTKKCYIYNFEANDIYLVDVDTLLGFEGDMSIFDEINEESKTAHSNTIPSTALTDENLPYNYFQNSNLSAWKVWYCLDNDKSRFAWADPVNGKGVIYRLIDEWNNDVAYDFKNIQFVRKLTDGELDTSNGTDTWVYTFNAYDVQESAIKEASVLYGYTILEEFICEVSDNYICSIRDNYTPAFKLSNNCFLGIIDEDAERNVYFKGNKFVNSCFDNTIGNGQRECICNRLYNKTAIGNYNIFINNKKVLTES